MKQLRPFPDSITFGKPLRGVPRHRISGIPRPHSPLRVALTGFHHESNTFAPVAASLDQFRAAGPVERDALVAMYGESQATLGGFLELASQPDLEVVPLFHADLNPMGTITTEAFETLVARMLEMLQSDGPFDVVLLALHGAAVAEHQPDADGEIIERVRRLVGPDVVIGVALDMHANVSKRMVQHSTIINAYLTNPHVDPRVRARQVADLAVSTARGEIRPVAAHLAPPLAINILRQGTSDWPMRRLVEMANDMQSQPGVLSISVIEGFPYADVAELGMSFIAITDDDQPLAESLVATLAEEAWKLRDDFVGNGVDIDTALVRASQATKGPVVLLDVGDNVGGGSPADSTHVLAAARRLRIGNLFHSLCDPESVRRCIDAGLGARVALEVGGKTDGLHGTPVPISGVVSHLDDGRFEDTGVTHGGFRFFNAGPRALVHTDDDQYVLLASRPMGNTSRAELTSVGLDPSSLQVIVAKGVHSPRGAFEPIASEMIQLNSPGCTSADLSLLSYTRRSRPMFPFEPETTFDPARS
jgi:microcystin degradation protein MlrC